MKTTTKTILACIAIVAVLAAACGTQPHPTVVDSFASGCKIQHRHTSENDIQAISMDLIQIPASSGCNNLAAFSLYARFTNTTTGVTEDRTLATWYNQDGGFGYYGPAQAGEVIIDSWIRATWNGTAVACRYHGTDQDTIGGVCAPSI